jgi:transposase
VGAADTPAMGGAGMVNGRRLAAADVHARSSCVSVVDLGSGELRRRRVKGPPSAVLDVVAEFGPEVKLIYEAGPTGFGLARAGRERGIPVFVCAPGSIPRAPGDRVKTDRRDADRLVRLWAAGELSLARIPSAEEEAFRDLVRAREDARSDLMRHRHRLSKFLLRRELECAASAWSVPWMNWVGGLRLGDPLAQTTLIDYVAAVGFATQRRQTLDAAIEQAWPESPFAETIARLRCFRGINTLTAAGLAAEIGDFGRFAHPARLAGFLGIVPSEDSSGQRRRQGSITKAGPGHARRLLIEAAQHARHPARVRETLARRQRGQDPRVIAVAWRAQQRLHTRHQYLTRRGKPHGVVTVALARELACFCWEAARID